MTQDSDEYRTLYEEQLKKNEALSAEMASLRAHSDSLQAGVRRSLRKAEEWRLAHDEISNTTSFLLGRRLVGLLEKPSSILSLPRDVLQLWRSRQVESPDARPIDQSDLFDLYLAEGLREFLGQTEIVLAELSQAEQAEQYLSLAQLFNDAGLADVQFELLKRSHVLNNTPHTIAALYYSARNQLDIETAARMVSEYEAIVRSDSNASKDKRLQRMRRDPIAQLNTRSLVPARRAGVSNRIAGRICYVLHNSLPYASGGYATRAHGMAQALHEVGYDVHCLTRPGFPVDLGEEHSDELPDQDQIDGVTYHRTFAPRRRTIPFREYVPRAAEALQAKIEALNPQFVVAASNYIVALPALIAARNLGLPFVYEVRGFWEITRLSRQPDYVHDNGYHVQRAMETFVGQQADQVATLTGAMAEEMVARGLSADKITILPNACDVTKFTRAQTPSTDFRAKLGIPEGVCVIGYVGTFVDYEGLPDLVDACSLLRSSGIELRLLLVGSDNTADNIPGPVSSAVKNRAEDSGMDDWLIMPGRVPHEQVPQFYETIDIAAFPRRAWPVCEMVSPMKPLEALSLEKTVIVSSVGALREMINDGVTGLVFEKENKQSLADTLRTAIESPSLRRQLGSNGRRWVAEHRTWRKIAERYVEVLSTAEQIATKELT